MINGNYPPTVNNICDECMRLVASTAGITQLFAVWTEVCTRDSVSMPLEVSLQGGVLLQRQGSQSVSKTLHFLCSFNGKKKWIKKKKTDRRVLLSIGELTLVK